MSDLSRLLSDVYGDGGATEPAIPEWSSDEALDDTFASWVPGPPADAPAAERAFSIDADEDAPARERPTFDEVFAAFGPDDASELYAEADGDAVAEPTEAVAIADLSELDDVDDVDERADLAGVTDGFTPEPQPVAAAPAPAPFVAPPAITRWIPSDDDILPLRGTAAKRLTARSSKPAAPALPKEPKEPRAKLQLGRKAKVTVAVPVPEDAPLEELVDRADPAPAPADAPAPAEVAPARRRGRKPAPRHAKPKEGLRLSRRSKPAVKDDEPVASEPVAKRRSFRLR